MIKKLSFFLTRQQGKTQATIDALRTEIEILRAENASLHTLADGYVGAIQELEKYKTALVMIYKAGGSVQVAQVADEYLDKSGALLGHIREAAQ